MNSTIPLVVVFAVGLISGSAVAQTIEFQRTPSLPDGVTISVLSDGSDVTPTLVEPEASGWTYSYVLNPIRWREEPTFLIAIPTRTVAKDGVDSPAIVLELDFSFKATERDRVVEVPLHAFLRFGNAERSRIERLPIFSQFEQLTLSQGLTRHFEARLNANDGLTRRMAQIWFDTVVRAIQPVNQEQRRPLRLGATVIDTVQRIFDGNSDKLNYFRASAAQIRATFWWDIRDAPALLDMRQCGLLKLLAEDLRLRHTAYPGDAVLMRVADPEATLDALDADVASCS